MTTPIKKGKPGNVNLYPEVAEKARDAAFALAGPPALLTVTGLVNAAVEREIIRLQDEYNAGKRFPKRSSAVRKGRPIR